jgi:hypothetical protein
VLTKELLRTVCPTLRKLIECYLGKVRFTTDLDGDGPTAAMPHACGCDFVAGALCACAEGSALVFDLPDEVLAACAEGWTAVHGLLVPRMEVITNGPDDCSPLPDDKILRETRVRCPTLGESNSMFSVVPLITWLLPNSHVPSHLRPLLAQRSSTVHHNLG